MVQSAVCLWGTLLALAAAEAPAAAPSSSEAVSAVLRQHLIRAMPAVLYEARPGWGTQKVVFRGMKWHGEAGSLRAEVQRGPKNHGTWRHIRITAGNLEKDVVLNLGDLQYHEPGRTTFTVNLSFPARLDFTQQNWQAGVKLYDGSVRARFRVLLTIDCELTSRVEASLLLPEAVVRVRVLRADLKYNDLVVEHIAGVGGELAQVLGKSVHDGMRQWHPSLERNLLAKANAAIVKAGDTGEVKVGLQALLKPKKLLSIRPRAR